jgi:hypothetical protein
VAGGEYVDSGTYQADYSAAQPYIVERPVYENPSSVATGLPIRIVNPASNRTALNYTLDGDSYTILPGVSQDLLLDRACVIEFDRGKSFGSASYSLESAQYVFTPTNHGWELFQKPLLPSESTQPAPNPLPTTNLVANPLPGSPR